MSLASIKIATEEYIVANWIRTPIFYDTQDIEGEEAIHLSFIPIARELYSAGCGVGRKLDYTMLKVRFYSTNSLKICQLQDEFIQILECWENDNTHYEVATPDGLGSVNLTNGIVESSISFNARTYN